MFFLKGFFFGFFSSYLCYKTSKRRRKKTVKQNFPSWVGDILRSWKFVNFFLFLRCHNSESQIPDCVNIYYWGYDIPIIYNILDYCPVCHLSFVVPSWKPRFPVSCRLLAKERIINIGWLEDFNSFLRFEISLCFLAEVSVLGSQVFRQASRESCEPAYCV